MRELGNDVSSFPKRLQVPSLVNDTGPNFQHFWHNISSNQVHRSSFGPSPCYLYFLWFKKLTQEVLHPI
jgi:hypothetical protein